MEEYWIEEQDGTDGRTYHCVMSNRVGSPFTIVRSEHLTREAAMKDMAQMLEESA